MSNRDLSTIENDSRYADHRHPVDFLEPRLSKEEITREVCDVLRRVFGWVAEADSAAALGLRASVALHCVRPELADRDSLNGLGREADCARQEIDTLIAGFRQTIGLQAEA